jgi:AAA domain
MMAFLREIAASGEPPDESSGEEAKANEAPPLGEEQKQNQATSWLQLGEKPLIRRAGHIVPNPVAFLVEGMLHEIGTSNFAGKWKTGKTYAVMAIAASVLTGLPFAGRQVFRQGAVLWLAAEGEREVDLRIRAAVTALGQDPDNIPFFVQLASVPKLLADKGSGIGSMVWQAKRWAKHEFKLPLALVVFDTMIKSAGYTKSEDSSTEVNAVIDIVDKLARGYKCHATLIDHAGHHEDRARGSSDKPSSVDTSAVIKKLKPGRHSIYFDKVRGLPAEDTLEFRLMTMEVDGQKTAVVSDAKWLAEGGDGGGGSEILDLKGNDKLLYDILMRLIANGQQYQLFAADTTPRKCAKMSEVKEEFYKHHGGTESAPRMAFGRSWEAVVVKHDPPLFSTKKTAKNSKEMLVFCEE